MPLATYVALRTVRLPLTLLPIDSLFVILVIILVVDLVLVKPDDHVHLAMADNLIELDAPENAVPFGRLIMREDEVGLSLCLLRIVLGKRLLEVSKGLGVNVLVLALLVKVVALPDVADCGESLLFRLRPVSDFGNRLPVLAREESSLVLVWMPLLGVLVEVFAIPDQLGNFIPVWDVLVARIELKGAEVADRGSQGST